MRTHPGRSVSFTAPPTTIVADHIRLSPERVHSEAVRRRCDLHARVAHFAKQALLDTLPPGRIVRVESSQSGARHSRLGAKTHQLWVGAAVKVPRHHLRVVGGRQARGAAPR